jgi:cell division septum initiation protein DivIVA
MTTDQQDQQIRLSRSAPGHTAGMGDSQSSDPSEPHEPRFPREASASEWLTEVSFPLAMRGYDRAAVDEFVHGIRALVAELEADQTREGAVQKALDDVGVETASILQRAHATADALASRSQAEADSRLRHADSEADQVRREADEYSEQVVVDTRLLWEERQRLIEDIRQLADEVLATADDAIERLKLPEPLAAAEAGPEPATAETPAAGPVGVPDPDVVRDESSTDDTAAWGLGEVEAEPPQDETGRDEPGALGDEPPSAEEDSGHTVELEALPGGADQPAADPEEPASEGQRPPPESDPQGNWDREGDWDRERD